MKKSIILSVFALTLSAGCSPKNWSNSTPPAPHPGQPSDPAPQPNNPDPDQKQKHVIEGTVVKLFNLLIPSAHASALVDCAPEVESCAKLIDEGTSEVIDAVPVKDSKFRFELEKEIPADHLYRVVIVKKGDGSYKRVGIFLGEEKNIMISPETTVSHEIRKQLIKEKLESVSGDREKLKVALTEVKDKVDSFLQALHENLKEGNLSLRETLKLAISAFSNDFNSFVKETVANLFEKSVRNEPFGSELRENIRDIELEKVDLSEQALLERESKELVRILSLVVSLKNSTRVKAGTLANAHASKAGELRYQITLLWHQKINLDPEDIAMNEAVLAEIDLLNEQSSSLFHKNHEAYLALIAEINQKIDQIQLLMLILKEKDPDFLSELGKTEADLLLSSPITKEGHPIRNPFDGPR